MLHAGATAAAGLSASPLQGVQVDTRPAREAPRLMTVNQRHAWALAHLRWQETVASFLTKGCTWKPLEAPCG